ncbi:regulatory protein NPR5 [Dendrobium catenatum]|uniref:Regulatory protein NPR5 n=1 Tax=Dendrobium catenatum TaxID=906689 RepID=A0A2I0VLH7_9ASPA|nr:regulatory protein NPR5 [Dendrobium catenatum]PKU64251.1 Regulatory protein NPR5 [Dendrobium catenatum]
MEAEAFKSLSMDFLNLLINGQAFSDVTFSVEGRLVHAHRCILAGRSPFFRRFFDSPPAANLHRRNNSSLRSSLVIPVNSVGYEVFLLVLQFLYSGQVSLIPPKHDQRPNCAERGCWHTHCSSAIDLALDTLAAARSFGVEELVFLTQKQLENMVEKASIEDAMRVLLASRKQEMHQLWNTCSHLVAKSGLPPEVLAKHLPIDIVAKIEELRIESSFSRRPSFLHNNHHLPLDIAVAVPKHDDYHHKIRRMRRALDSSDVELVKLMVMGEGLNLDEALALHYSVQNCSREVVKALLELGAANVNLPAGPTGKTPLHVASEMVSPDMVAVLLDHHADPNVRTTDDITPLDILRSLTSDFLFKGALPGLSHIEPNKLRLCLELVQSAVMVLSREEAAATATNGNSNNAGGAIYHPLMSVEAGDMGNENVDSSLSLDSKMVYLNLGMAAVGSMDCDSSRNRSQGSSGGIGLSSIYSQHDHFP